MTTTKTPPHVRNITTCGKWYALVLIALLTAACGQKTVNTHGHVIPDRRLAAIEKNVTTKEGVRRLLGTPPITGAFDENKWIYITETTRQKTFGEQALQNRQIITISFDAETNLVTDIQKTDATKSRDITFSNAQTPTSGQSMGVIDQLLDNIGVKP